MKKVILSIFVMVMTVAGTTAQGLLTDAELDARLGYSLGGTAPHGMPASIRKLNQFPMKLNVSTGVDVQKTLKGRWGMLTGLHFENKSMETDCTVKNYHMQIVRGGETLEGMFTGNVVTKATEWMLTVPVLGTFKVSDKVTVKAGPYVSFLTCHEFSGYAYNGYIRVGDPTGEKVNLGEGPDERGDYDFSNDMRRVQVGLDFGADWKLSDKFGLYADLTWGVTGIHKSDFKTIEQTLYPIFGTMGLVYRFKH